LTRPLCIAIDARLPAGLSGGLEQFVIGLVAALSSLTDGDEEYLVLVSPGDDGWIRPYVSGPCHIVKTRGHASLIGTQRRIARAAPRLTASWRRYRDNRFASASVLPESDGTIERMGTDVMHFTTQRAFVSDVPSLYHPWDLQHLHFPEFFSVAALQRREFLYRAFCDRSRLVVTAAEWTRADLIHQYGLPDNKVVAVQIPPVMAAYGQPSETAVDNLRRKFDLPERFAFYPAQTWPHKNHLGVLRALAMLRDRFDLSIPLVCSGYQNEYYATIREEITRLSLTEHVRFVGFVAPRELRSLYRMSSAVVFASLFEGWGFPVLEAFAEGVPVACSSATTLPETAGSAALLFDPTDESSIADALRRVWTDDVLRAELVSRGTARLHTLDWPSTARRFRGYYRQIADPTLAV